MRLAAGLLAIASLIAAVDGQMNLYDPNDDVAKAGYLAAARKSKLS